MPYCVKCGVELGDAEKSCPLCATPVILPDNMQADHKNVHPLFPPAKESRETPAVSRGGLVLLLTLIFFTPISLTMICDISINHDLTWSSFVSGALLLLYLFIIPPIIAAPHGNVFLFLTLDGIGTAVYLYIVEEQTKIGWFWQFAFPMVAAVTLYVMLMTLLSRKTQLSQLKLAAVAIALIGVLCLFTELMLNFAFGLRSYLIWSLYPLTSFLLLGAILLVIDLNPSLKEKLERFFFV